MNKIITLSIFCTIFFSACVDPIGTKPTIDSTTAKVDTAHSITVDNPLDPVPHPVRDSIYNGESIKRYPNGVIFMKGDVAGGLRTGEWLSFWPDGKPYSKGVYKDGLRQGYGVSWGENGQKTSEGYYKDDKPIGKWTYWDDYGNAVVKDFGGQ